MKAPMHDRNGARGAQLAVDELLCPRIRKLGYK